MKVSFEWDDHEFRSILTFVSVFPSVESTASWSELFRKEGITFKRNIVNLDHDDISVVIDGDDFHWRWRWCTYDGGGAKVIVLVVYVPAYIHQQHGLQYDYGDDEDTKMEMDLTWCTWN